jgi:hypothetical protein
VVVNNSIWVNTEKRPSRVLLPDPATCLVTRKILEQLAATLACQIDETPWRAETKDGEAVATECVAVVDLSLVQDQVSVRRQVVHHVSRR